MNWLRKNWKDEKVREQRTGFRTLNSCFPGSQNRDPGHPIWYMINEHREDGEHRSYLSLSSASNSLRASHELTVLTALFLPSFWAQRSKSSDMLTWAKRNLPSFAEV